MSVTSFLPALLVIGACRPAYAQRGMTATEGEGAVRAGDEGGFDLDGDGYDDVLTLSPPLPTQVDLATPGSAAITIVGSSFGKQRGSALGTGGDLNGDRSNELLVGPIPVTAPSGDLSLSFLFPPVPALSGISVAIQAFADRIPSGAFSNLREVSLP